MTLPIFLIITFLVPLLCLLDGSDGQLQVRNISRRIDFFRGLESPSYHNGDRYAATSTEITGLVTIPSRTTVLFLTGAVVRSYNWALGTVGTYAGPLPNAQGAATVGNANGHRAATLFSSLNAVAHDPATDSLVLADRSMLRLVDLETEWVLHLAGSTFTGYVNANGSEARFQTITGVAFDIAGDVIAVDQANRCLRRVTRAGLAAEFAGTCLSQGDSDGAVGEGRMWMPEGLAVHEGFFYVTDVSRNLVRRADGAGTLTTIAGMLGQRGTLDSSDGATATFAAPRAIAAGPDGLYVSQQFSIRKIDYASPHAVETYCGSRGFEMGACSTAKFAGSTSALSWNGSSTLVIGDFTRVLMAIDHNSRTLTHIALRQYVTGATGFGNSRGMVVVAGSLFVADRFAYCIKRVDLNDSDISEVVAGAQFVEGTADGHATDEARFEEIYSITSLSDTVIIVAMKSTCLKKFDITTSLVSTWAGSCVDLTPVPVDGPAIPTARLINVRSMTTSGNRSVYFYQETRHIRVVLAGTMLVRTLISNVAFPNGVDGDIANARLDSFSEYHLVWAREGVYFMSVVGSRLRRFDEATLTVTTVFGGESASIDGPLALARTTGGLGLSVGSDDSLYFAQTVGTPRRIRRMNNDDQSVATVSVSVSPADILLSAPLMSTYGDVEAMTYSSSDSCLYFFARHRVLKQCFEPMTLTPTITATESRSVTLSASGSSSRSESASLSSTPTVTPPPTLTPSVSTSWTSTLILTPTFTDSESHTRTDSAALTPTFTLPLTSSVTQTTTRPHTDSFSVSMSLSNTISISLSSPASASVSFTLSASVSYSSSLSWSLSTTNSGSITSSDTASISSSPTCSRSYSSTLSESLTRTESAPPSISESISQTWSVSSTVSASVTTTTSSSISASESETRSNSVSASSSTSYTYSVSSTESTPPTPTLSISVSVTLSETHTTSPSQSESLSRSLSSSPSRSVSDSLSDSVTMSSSASVSLTPPPTGTPTQSTSLSQSVSTSVTTSSSRSTSSSSSQSISHSLPPTATLTVSSSPSASSSRSPSFSSSKTHSLSVTSSSSHTLPATRSFSDTPSRTPTKTWSLPPTRSNTITVTHTISRSGSTTASSSESASSSGTSSPSSTRPPTVSWTMSRSRPPTRSYSKSASDSASRTHTSTPTTSMTGESTPTASYSATQHVRTATPFSTPTIVPNCNTITEPRHCLGRRDCLLDVEGACHLDCTWEVARQRNESSCALLTHCEWDSNEGICLQACSTLTLDQCANATMCAPDVAHAECKNVCGGALSADSELCTGSSSCQWVPMLGRCLPTCDHHELRETCERYPHCAWTGESCATHCDLLMPSSCTVRWDCRVERESALCVRACGTLWTASNCLEDSVCQWNESAIKCEDRCTFVLDPMRCIAAAHCTYNVTIMSCLNQTTSEPLDQPKKCSELVDVTSCASMPLCQTSANGSCVPRCDRDSANATACTESADWGCVWDEIHGICATECDSLSAEQCGNASLCKYGSSGCAASCRQLHLTHDSCAADGVCVWDPVTRTCIDRCSDAVNASVCEGLPTCVWMHDDVRCGASCEFAGLECSTRRDCKVGVDGRCTDGCAHHKSVGDCVADAQCMWNATWGRCEQPCVDVHHQHECNILPNCMFDSVLRQCIASESVNLTEICIATKSQEVCLGVAGCQIGPGGTCVAKCEDLLTKRACLDSEHNGCRWDQEVLACSTSCNHLGSVACVQASSCRLDGAACTKSCESRYRDPTSCNDDPECTWDAFTCTELCVAEGSAVACESFVTCQWDHGRSTCGRVCERSTTECTSRADCKPEPVCSRACEEVEQQEVCAADSACMWDAAHGKCHQDCTTVSHRSRCDLLRHCVFTTATQRCVSRAGTADEQCRAIQDLQRCAAVAPCFVGGQSECRALCSQRVSSGTQASCALYLQDGCTWNEAAQECQNSCTSLSFTLCSRNSLCVLLPVAEGRLRDANGRPFECLPSCKILYHDALACTTSSHECEWNALTSTCLTRCSRVGTTSETCIAHAECAWNVGSRTCTTQCAAAGASCTDRTDCKLNDEGSCERACAVERSEALCAVDALCFWNASTAQCRQNCSTLLSSRQCDTTVGCRFSTSAATCVPSPEDSLSPAPTSRLPDDPSGPATAHPPSPTAPPRFTGALPPGGTWEPWAPGETLPDPTASGGSTVPGPTPVSTASPRSASATDDEEGIDARTIITRVGIGAAILVAVIVVVVVVLRRRAETARKEELKGRALEVPDAEGAHRQTDTDFRGSDADGLELQELRLPMAKDTDLELSRARQRWYDDL